MKSNIITIASLSLIAAITSGGEILAQQSSPRFRHVGEQAKTEVTDTLTLEKDTLDLRVRDVDEIIAWLDTPDFKAPAINKVFGPWVFLGYKSLVRKPTDTTLPMYVDGIEVISGDSVASEMPDLAVTDLEEGLSTDSLTWSDWEADSLLTAQPEAPGIDMSVFQEGYIPKFLKDALRAYRIQEDFMYQTMVTEPGTIDYSYWDLPVPPRLLDDDVTFAGYIRRLNLPEVDQEKAVLPDEQLRKIHWLHNFGSSLRFSQAYVSSNWYQGGNGHISLLFNIYWNFQLNQVYHPNVLLQSALSYKLGMNSTPTDEVHDYSISEDLLQYNLNVGLNAFKKWFYSFNLQFKTPFFRNYENNSNVRKASFLSPGDLNVGLGMAYTYKRKDNTLQFTATISPFSFNLKTCISDKVDHERFKISPNHHAKGDIGSNGEFNMQWAITPNINYRTRLFLFSDYSYFLSDWENSITFAINKFLTTQIDVHMRYDTSSETTTSWKHFMLREVLSFGLSYTFSTKP